MCKTYFAVIHGLAKFKLSVDH